ncbi:DNA-directed DNA polymerase [Caerostris extrusa]|uniref:DNA-directed DNA polymerase n=1 Tax=Caerostris extrusa TaxID=172846 RepID=A0AAV4RTE2_CAEEX|nr:DNA-directed DNA polymerase [Caerostris extrusa]
MPLPKISDCFGFKELRKGYFPHLLTLNKTKITKEPFLKTDFTVLILWDQQLVRDHSLCSSLYVTPNTIAMVPIHGYVNDIRYSTDFIRWLDFVSHNENIVILYALNGTGEKKIHGIFVDGYCLETNTVYQYHAYLPPTSHPKRTVGDKESQGASIQLAAEAATKEVVPPPPVSTMPEQPNASKRKNPTSDDDDEGFQKVTSKKRKSKKRVAYSLRLNVQKLAAVTLGDATLSIILFYSDFSE